MSNFWTPHGDITRSFAMLFLAEYNAAMKYELLKTKIFDEWFNNLDRSVKNRLIGRFNNIENGNFGDFKEIENALFELRFFFGGGIRIYFTIRQQQVVLLLNGGNKDGQSKDIEKAKKIIRNLED